jgi:hypothetical protein
MAAHWCDTKGLVKMCFMLSPLHSQASSCSSGIDASLSESVDIVSPKNDARYVPSTKTKWSAPFSMCSTHMCERDPGVSALRTTLSAVAGSLPASNC